MTKSTVYLLVEYDTPEDKFTHENYTFKHFNSLTDISDKCDIAIKTLSKIIVGETKGEKGRSSEFLKTRDIIKVYLKRINDYSDFVQNMAISS